MTLEQKIEEMKGLVKVLELNARFLTREEKSEVDNLEYKLEFNLKKLLDDCKMKEVDMKIESMKKIIKLLKKE